MIKKEFIGTTWIEAISKVKRFIDEYNLELLRLELVKNDKDFVAKVYYDLGVR